MAKITNTPRKNAWGDGYEQEVTLDNGDRYTIRNTPTKNAWGDGNVKEIVKQKSSVDTTWLESIFSLIMGFGMLGIIWLIIKLM